MRKLLTILLVVLFLGGCNHSEQIDGPRKIDFGSKVTKTDLVENVTDLQQQDVKVYGSYSLDGRVGNLFDAERLYYDNALPGWVYDNTQYWINGALYRFGAVSPYYVACSFSDYTGKTTITNYSSNSDADDLLYAATDRDLRNDDDFSTVLLQFRHACAAVEFELINGSNSAVTDVRNIRLVGLHNTGNFIFDSAGAEWVLYGTTVDPNSAVQPFGGACTLPDGGLPVNVDVRYPLYDGGAIMVLPQTVYKTPVTLHLEYIKEGDAEYAVRDIELGNLGGYAPHEWKAGEKYKYTMTITDNTITFSVEVLPWVDHYVDL